MKNNLACGARDEYATPSEQVDNSPQSVIGSARGACNLLARVSGRFIGEAE